MDKIEYIRQFSGLDWEKCILVNHTDGKSMDPEFFSISFKANHMGMVVIEDDVCYLKVKKILVELGCPVINHSDLWNFPY